MSDLQPVDPILVPIALGLGFVVGAVVSCCCCRRKSRPDPAKTKAKAKDAPAPEVKDVKAPKDVKDDKGGKDAKKQEADPCGQSAGEDLCAKYRVPNRYASGGCGGQRFGNYGDDTSKEKGKDEKDITKEKPAEKEGDQPKEDIASKCGGGGGGGCPAVSATPAFSCSSCYPPKMPTCGFGYGCGSSGGCGGGSGGCGGGSGGCGGSSRYSRCISSGMGCKLPRVSNAFIRATGW